MKRVLCRRGVAAALVVVVAVAVGGIAYASIPDANGVIHGCYNSDNGALRVFGKSKDFQQCNAGEKPLDWSQTGPTGATGATGPSDAFFDGDLFANTTIGTTPVTVIALSSVPVGKYVLNASLAFINLNASSTSVGCFVFLNGVVATPEGRVSIGGTGSELAMMPLTFSLDLAVPTTVEVRCRSGLASGVVSQQPSGIAMIRVGSLIPA